MTYVLQDMSYMSVYMYSTQGTEHAKLEFHKSISQNMMKICGTVKCAVYRLQWSFKVQSTFRYIKLLIRNLKKSFTQELLSISRFQISEKS